MVHVSRARASAPAETQSERSPQRQAITTGRVHNDLGQIIGCRVLDAHFQAPVADPAHALTRNESAFGRGDDADPRARAPSGDADAGHE